MALQYSEFDNNMNGRISNVSTKNKTYKRRENKKSKKVEEFLNSMDTDEDELANFTPPENDIAPESLSDLNINASAQQYYKQHIHDMSKFTKWL